MSYGVAIQSRIIFIYLKMTLDSKHILKSSTPVIQQKLDEYAQNGWRLVSTNATNFGLAIYIYLIF